MNVEHYANKLRETIDQSVRDIYDDQNSDTVKEFFDTLRRDITMDSVKELVSSNYIDPLSKAGKIILNLNHEQWREVVLFSDVLVNEISYTLCARNDLTVYSCAAGEAETPIDIDIFKYMSVECPEQYKNEVRKLIGNYHYTSLDNVYCLNLDPIKLIELLGD